MISAVIIRNLVVTCVALGFVLQSLDARAQEALRPLPPILRAISDEVGALSTSEGEALAGIVADVGQTSGVRIIIAIVETTMPESIEIYTQRLQAYWGAHRPPSKGEEEVFIVVAAKDRTIRIASGVNMTAIVERVSNSKLMLDVGPLLRSGKYFPALALIVEGLSQAIRLDSYVEEKSYFSARGAYPAARLSTALMLPLDEGNMLYMPNALAGLLAGEAGIGLPST